MARKVFISVLGTGFYGECQYAKGDFRSTPTRFIQQAMMEYHNVKSWSEDDRAYILLTDKARKENWNIPSGKRMNRNTNEEEDYLGLEEVLADIPAVRDVSIPDGKDEEEMWQIFSIVFDLLKEGDELYIDLTHSFRYLPMLLLVLTNYAHFLKHIEVKAVGYGNYEARDRDTNIAPLVDLLPLVALQRWTFAAADFTENGNVEKLEVLTTTPAKTMKKLFSMQGDMQKRETTGNLINFINKLKLFNDELKLCRGINIYESNSYKSAVKSADTKQNLIVPLRPIIENIVESISIFSQDPTAYNLLAAARWCYEKNLYQAAITTLQEGIVTLFCDKYGIGRKAKKEREVVNAAFIKNYHTFFPSRCNDDYKPFEDEVKETKVNEICKDPLLQDESVIANFNNLSELRNDFQHCGMRPNSKSASVIKEAIRKYIEYFSCLFSEKVKSVCHLSSLFINLSNHPSCNWDEAQLHAARQYGDIEDMPFPQVDPEADDEEISCIADEYTRQIISEAADNDVTVHVMGEMSLTFAIVKRLQNHGIRCVSSTSERISEDLPDGTRKVGFSFKRFRQYEY